MIAKSIAATVCNTTMLPLWPHSKVITINHAVAPYTCKVQGAITIRMPALAPSEGEQLVFGQIYIMDSTQDQSITRSVHIPVIPVVF